MKKAIILQLLALCFVACQKQELTTLAEGRVLAINSNLPIADADVVLSLYNNTQLSFLGSTAWSKIAKVTKTDKNGRYQFIISPPEEDFSYRVIVPINPNEYSYDVEATTASVSKYGGTSTHDFRIKPFGWLNIHLKNTSPVDENDEFVFTNHTLGTFKGKEDRIILAKTRGDSTYSQSLSFKVTKNKVESFKYIYFKTSSNDTTQLNVFY